VDNKVADRAPNYIIGNGLNYFDRELSIDAEYIKGLIAAAITSKQDAFTVGDGLKLVDGVLSLDLETWQGGEY
jgi:hypothetical protein